MSMWAGFLILTLFIQEITRLDLRRHFSIFKEKSFKRKLGGGLNLFLDTNEGGRTAQKPEKFPSSVFFSFLFLFISHFVQILPM